MSARHLAARAPTRWRRPEPPQALGRAAPELEGELRSRLVAAPPTDRVLGWVVALAVAGVAALLRLVHLGRPGRLVFDETYYVKQAYSLLTLGYEGQWPDDADDAFAAGDFSELSTEAAYVVHPPLGKWMIAAGMRLLGPDNPAGWRFGAAVIGALSVLLLVRIARHLFGSTLLGGAAGLLLAVDGTHLVMSRISILDIFVQFWILAAFGALLADRASYRRRLARAAAQQLARSGTYSTWGPSAGFRWWLLLSGVLAGLACAVKWSGAYAIAVFGLMAVLWTLTARRSIGLRSWAWAGIARDGVLAFFTMVPAALAAYLATWSGWFAGSGGYNRQWAVQDNAAGAQPVRTWMPDALNSWWEYHRRMWDFHTTLTSEHTYQAHPLGWLLQWRPTSFAWRTLDDATAPEACGALECARAITSVGNPVIWWGAAAALLLVFIAAVVHRDWRAGAILAGYAAAYAPWLLYTERTIFTFYTVAFAPFTVLALTFALGHLIGGPDEPLRYRRAGIWTAGAIVALALAAAAFFWPVWTYETIPIEQWRWRMWLPTWV